MRRPSPKLIAFFLVALLAGYTLSYFMMLLLNVELRDYGFLTLSIVAFLIAFVLVIAFDGILELGAFEWPQERERPAGPDQAEASQPAEAEELKPPETTRGMFPYEPPTEHWDVDFGDNQQTYEGTELPIWLLAGWAAFILWAVIYLISGLPGAFQ
jgi:hypothetical protein